MVFKDMIVFGCYSLGEGRGGCCRWAVLYFVIIVGLNKEWREKRPHEGWSSAATEQGCARKEAWSRPLVPAGKHGPISTLNSNSPSPTPLLVLAFQFVAFCYGSPEKRN